MEGVLDDLGLASFVLRHDGDASRLPPGFRDTTGGLVCAGNATRTDGVLTVHGSGFGVVDSMASGRPLGEVTAEDAARLRLQCFHCSGSIRGVPQFVVERSGRVNTTPFCSTACRLGYVMHTRGADSGLMHSVLKDLATYGVRPDAVEPAEPAYMLMQHGGVYSSRDLRTRRGVGQPGFTAGRTVTLDTMPHVVARLVTSRRRKARRRPGIFPLSEADTDQMFPENHGVAHGLRRLRVNETGLSRPVRLTEGPMMDYYIARRERGVRWMRSHADVKHLIEAVAEFAKSDNPHLPGDGESKASDPNPPVAWPSDPLHEPGSVIEVARTGGGAAALQRAMGIDESELTRIVDKLAVYHEKMEEELARDFPYIASVMDPTGIEARRIEKAQGRKSGARKGAT